MAESDPHPDWNRWYANAAASWDIGRPQAAFVRLADAGALTGVLLDAGCGTGEHTILAARRGARAIGIDVASLAIETAKRKAVDRGVQASFYVLDALRADTLGETFDTVVDSGLFHVLDDEGRTRYIAAIRSVLRPAGHMHLMCFSDRQPGDRGPRRITEAELRDAFATGWRVNSLAPDRFDVNHMAGPTQAEASLVDLIAV